MTAACLLTYFGTVINGNSLFAEQDGIHRLHEEIEFEFTSTRFFGFVSQLMILCVGFICTETNGWFAWPDSPMSQSRSREAGDASLAPPDPRLVIRCGREPSSLDGFAGGDLAR